MNNVRSAPAKLLFTIICTLVMTGVAFAQDTQERCRNNKQRIVELDYQVFELKQYLYSGNTAMWMQFAREDYGSLNAGIANLSSPDWATNNKGKEVLDHIQSKGGFDAFAQGYGVNWPASVDKNDRGSLDRYFRAVRAGIQAKIERMRRATTSPDEVKQEVARLEKQIDSHKTNLAALDCDSTDASVPCSVQGTWDQKAEGVGGSVWIVTADGTAKEKGLGGAEGTATLSGQTMTIEWKHKNGWSGTYRWLMDAQCKQGTGELIFKSGGSGTKTSTVTHN